MSVAPGSIKNMRAAVMHAAEDLRVEDVEVPNLEPNEVMIRNAYCGICGSDIAMYFDPPSIGIDYSRPHPVTGTSLPQIIGHEFSGTVVAVGSEVGDLAVGKNVVAFPMIHCGDCTACQAGLDRICENLGTHGFTSKSGGLATYSVIPREKLYELPAGVSLKLGALVEPLAVAWHAVRRSGIRPGQRALIIGGGPIGVGLALALRASRITEVYISELSASRRSVVNEIGIATLMNPTELDSLGAISVVFDAAGNSRALDQALDLLEPQGTAVIVAIYKKPLELTGATIALKELRVLGSLAYERQDFVDVISAMDEGSIAADYWVETSTLDDLEKTIQELANGQHMKVLIDLQSY